MIEEIKLAKLFHDTYERLAPSYGYETRKETREFDENSKNGQLMIATCKEILDKYNNQQTLVTLKDFENVSNKLIDYKSAWDELKEYCGCLGIITYKMQELEQKYNLGGE